MEKLLLFICILTFQLTFAEQFSCEKPIVSPKCESFIVEKELIKFNDKFCASDRTKCLCNKHQSYDRSLREYDHRSILFEYDQMIGSLNIDSDVQKWFDKTDGKAPTYEDCKGAVSFSECKAYNAFCMSEVLKTSLDEDIKKYSDHVNLCSNPRYIKSRYIDNEKYSDLTFEEKKQKALSKCRSHHRKLKELHSYIPSRRNKINSSKLPHTTRFFDRAIEDMKNINTLEQMQNNIESIEQDKQEISDALRVQGLLEKCRKSNDNDVYSRDIEGQVSGELEVCNANEYYSQDEISVLMSDWERVKSHITDKEFTALNKKITLALIPSSAMASWKNQLCNHRDRPFNKADAYTHIKKKLNNHSYHSKEFDSQLDKAWSEFVSSGQNEVCSKTPLEDQQALDKLNSTLSTFNNMCTESSNEHFKNLEIYNRVPMKILQNYTKYNSNTRFSGNIPNDLLEQVKSDPERFLNKDDSSSDGEYDLDFLAKVMIANHTGNPSIFMHKNSQSEQKDLMLYLNGLAGESVKNTCGNYQSSLRHMDNHLKKKELTSKTKVNKVWRELSSSDPVIASMFAMDSVRDNVFRDQKIGANLNNWFDKYCTSRTHNNLPFKKISMKDYQSAKVEMQKKIGTQLEKVNNSLNPNDLDARNANVFATLKSRPSVIAELLKTDASEKLTGQTCKLIEQIYNEDEFDYRSAQVVGGIAAGAGLLLMFTGVGSPLGASLLGASVALTTVEVGILNNNMNKAQEEKMCIQQNLSVGLEGIDKQLKKLVGVEDRYDDNRLGMYIAVFGLGFDALEGGALINKLARLKAVKNILGASEVAMDAKSWNKIRSQIQSGLKTINSQIKYFEKADPQIALKLKQNIESLNPEQISTLALLIKNMSKTEITKTLKFFGDSTSHGMGKVLDIMAKNPDEFIKSFGAIDLKTLGAVSGQAEISRAKNVAVGDIENSVNASSKIATPNNSEFSSVLNSWKNLDSVSSADNSKLVTDISKHLEGNGVSFTNRNSEFIIEGDSTSKLGQYAAALKKKGITVKYDPVFLRKNHIGGQYDESTSTLYIGHKSIENAKPGNAALHEVAHWKHSDRYINGADDQYNLLITSGREKIFTPDKAFIEKYNIDMKYLPYSTYFSAEEVNTYAKGMRQALREGKVDVDSLINNANYSRFSNEAIIFRSKSLIKTIDEIEAKPMLFVKDNLDFEIKTVNGKDMFVAKFTDYGRSGPTSYDNSEYFFEMILSTKEHIQLAKAFQAGDSKSGIEILKQIKSKAQTLKKSSEDINKSIDDILSEAALIKKSQKVSDAQFSNLLNVTSKNVTIARPTSSASAGVKSGDAGAAKPFADPQLPSKNGIKSFVADQSKITTSFNPVSKEHVLLGELIQGGNGKVLKGGMHTTKGLKQLIENNPDLAKIIVGADGKVRPEYIESFPSGVQVVKLPRPAFNKNHWKMLKNSAQKYKNNFFGEINGADCAGKTLFPPHWDESKILSAADDVIKNTNGVLNETTKRMEYIGESSGIKMTIIVEPDGSIKTMYPMVN